MMDIGTWAGWALWQFLYILFWTWPIWYVSWLAVAVTALSARTEYVKRGGGLKGLVQALWLGLKLMPRTMNLILRWVVQQMVFIASIAARRNIMLDLPDFLIRWLGTTIIETRIVETGKPVYRDRYKKVPRWWRITRFVLTALFGIACIRIYDYWYTVWPWILTWVV